MSNIRETITRIEAALAESEQVDEIFGGRAETDPEKLKERLVQLEAARKNSGKIISDFLKGVEGSKDKLTKLDFQRADKLKKKIESQLKSQAAKDTPWPLKKWVHVLAIGGVLLAAMAHSLSMGGEYSPLETIASLLTVSLFLRKGIKADPEQLKARMVEEFNKQMDFHIEHTRAALETAQKRTQ